MPRKSREIKIVVHTSQPSLGFPKEENENFWVEKISDRIEASGQLEEIKKWRSEERRVGKECRL